MALKSSRRTAVAVAALLSSTSLSNAAYIGSAPLLVPNGGTGAATFTVHGVIFGEGTSALAASATGASGIPLIGAGASADPVFGTAVVGGGGTGGTTFTAHGILVGEGSSAFAALSPAADSLPLWQASNADPTVTSVPNCADSAGNHLNYTTAAHTFTCGTTTSGGVAITLATATGASPITLATTNGLTTVVSMATPAASTINLPAIQASGWRECVKDGTTNFATNNATVKPNPTSLTIDGTAGTTGIVMNQAHQEACFISDGTNWFVE